ncbi:MAG: hypothetical protein LH702_24715 [Phormidesmis sp. CAN_BIN44]|nr:hypothetical protein [Phormidesmis sp. CAN_BIN44]
MAIEIMLERRTITLSPDEAALAKAATTRHALRLQFQTQLTARRIPYQDAGKLLLHEARLQACVTEFAHQLVYSPLADLRYFFALQTGIFLEPGYPPLYYASRKAMSPSALANKSAVAAVAEAIAGLLAGELFQLRKWATGYHDYPDLVMGNATAVYLVEAKGTTREVDDLRQVLDDELYRMAAYAAACNDLDRSRPSIGVVVGTALLSESRYHVLLNEVVPL